MRKKTWMENKETPMRKKTKDEEEGEVEGEKDEG